MPGDLLNDNEYNNKDLESKNDCPFKKILNQKVFCQKKSHFWGHPNSDSFESLKNHSFHYTTS